jgi:hypothetical protein
MATGLLLLVLVCLVAALLLPRPDTLPDKPKAASEPPHIPHPWSSGNPHETDDFAGPNAVYGPGTDDD